MRLVLATRNAHKVREFDALFEPHDVGALPDAVVLPPETGSTFAENAVVKARTAAQALGAAAIADDSGIEAAALNGAPGVRSARFAGEDATDQENLDKLLAEAPAGSALQYVCALAFVDADGTEHLVEGRCTGTLAAEPRGSGGFGYDPVFYDPVLGAGAAELEASVKHRVSHRGQALARMRELLSLANSGAT
jgi:XTP/dITP diphosphohydrolase